MPKKKRTRRENRKAQVTTFIIIGIAILGLIILGLMLNKKEVNTKNAPLSEEANNINNLVINCLDKTLEQTLREAGANGGYIIETGMLTKNGYYDYDSNYIDLPPQKIAYWYHLKPCDDNSIGCLTSEEPPLCREGSKTCPLNSMGPRSIEEQIETIMPQRVKECIKTELNLTGMDQITTIEKNKEPTIDLIITNKDVKAEMKYPIIIKLKDGSTKKINSFQTTADLNLAKIYSIADKIKEAEKRTHFLEQKTLDLLSIYSGVDKPIPPTRSLKLLGTKKFWITRTVKELIKEEVLPWMSFIQIADFQKSYNPIIISPEKVIKKNMSREEEMIYDGIYANLVVKLENLTYEEYQENQDYAVKIIYPYKEPKIIINNGAEILKPRSVETGNIVQKMLGLFMNDYRFRYDISYPLIVTITDTKAFNNNPYTFTIGLEPNIYHNMPLTTNKTKPRTTITTSIDFTAPTQLVKNTLVIDVKNALNNEPIPNASISYRCGSDYYLAETGKNGRLITRAPYCRYGGAIIVRKEGYMGTGISYDNYQEGILKNFTIKVWPLAEKKIRVMKRTPENIKNLLTKHLTRELLLKERSPLNKTELLMLTIKRIPGSWGDNKSAEYEEEIPIIGYYTFNKESQKLMNNIAARSKELDELVKKGTITEAEKEEYLKQLKSMNSTIPPQEIVVAGLTPGRYEIETYLINNKLIKIPEEKRSINIVGSLIKKHITLKAVNFTSWVSGGAMLLDNKSILISPNQLYNDDGITFYALEEGIPTTWTELENYQPLEEFLKGKELLEKPTFEKINN